jgi:hypothetical protein
MSEALSHDAPARATESTPDRRHERRLRCLLSGTIVFDNLATMDCTVRNISAYGAKAVIADAFRLPDEFKLRIPHHDKMHHAKVIWRKGDAAGFALSDVEDIGHGQRHRVTKRESERLRRKALDGGQV